MSESTLPAGDKAAAEVAKTPNRVSLEQLEALVQSVEYIRPTSNTTLTIAVIITENGYCVTGESAAADPKNFNEELGKKFAYDAALRKLWPLEGYLLRERLHKGDA